MYGEDQLSHLEATELAVRRRESGLPLDYRAQAAVSNLYRAAGAIRNHLEQTVLREASLSWTAFVVLWVVWVWDDAETRHVAKEAGISKGTLTGVSGTLEKRGLISRRTRSSDRRLVKLEMTEQGRELMEHLVPAFNEQESYVVAALSQQQVGDLTTALRHIVEHVEADRADQADHAEQPEQPGPPQ